MSTVNFNWDFKMSDGTTQSAQSTIDGMIFTGDDISECVYSVDNFGGSTTSQTVPFNYLNNRILNNTAFKATSGSLVSSLSSSIQTAFAAYAASSNIVSTYSSSSDQVWIQTASNATILVTTSTATPTTDVFDSYLGKYTFIVTGSTSGNKFILQLPELQVDGTVLNTTYNLTNGDTISVYGFQYDSDTIAYNVISKNISNETYSTVLLGDLSKTGSTLYLNIPDIGIRFAYSYTSTTSYKVVVQPIGSVDMTNVDIRRSSLYGGGSTETYTLDDGALPVAGINIDSTVYSQSNDASVVFVSYGGDTWEVIYWASASGVRFRSSARRIFID